MSWRAVKWVCVMSRNRELQVLDLDRICVDAGAGRRLMAA